MAELRTAPTETRDFIEHEQTFDGFLRLAAVGTAWVLTIVVALAIGGVAGHWILAAFLIVVSTIAAVLGLAVRGLDWRPVTVMLVVMLATLLVTTH